MPFETYANRMSLNEYYNQQLKPKKSCAKALPGKEKVKKDTICKLEQQEILFFYGIVSPPFNHHVLKNVRKKKLFRKQI